MPESQRRPRRRAAERAPPRAALAELLVIAAAELALRCRRSLFRTAAR